MKQYILVAGVDYEFKGVNFRIFCENRIKRILAKDRAREDMTFQIFDFRQGEITTQEIGFSSGQRLNKLTKKRPFNPITKANYDRNSAFKDGQSDVMSILDIYKSVQEIGANAPGTLIELSFFSHAWMGGPILVNSYDDGRMNISVLGSVMQLPLPSGARDPDDKDPRASKDFIAPTMDATALSNFQKAFKSDGYIWIWGCAFPRLVHEILYKLEHHWAYRASGLGDDVVFEFTNLPQAHVEMLEGWLAPLIGSFPSKRKIQIKFKYLKHFFCLITEASYSHHIAKNANIKTFAGLMGTYSEYDRGRLPLMSVHRGFAAHFRFYKNYLGFGFDPESRHYGEYKPNFSCTVPTP